MFQLTLLAQTHTRWINRITTSFRHCENGILQSHFTFFKWHSFISKDDNFWLIYLSHTFSLDSCESSSEKSYDESSLLIMAFDVVEQKKKRVSSSRIILFSCTYSAYTAAVALREARGCDYLLCTTWELKQKHDGAQRSKKKCFNFSM